MKDDTTTKKLADLEASDADKATGGVVGVPIGGALGGLPKPSASGSRLGYAESSTQTVGGMNDG